MINLLSIKQPPAPCPPKANANTVNSLDGGAGGGSGQLPKGGKGKSVCTVCKQLHHSLFSCQQLPNYIPEEVFKPFPKSVCRGCPTQMARTQANAINQTAGLFVLKPNTTSLCVSVLIIKHREIGSRCILTPLRGSRTCKFVIRH